MSIYSLCIVTLITGPGLDSLCGRRGTAVKYTADSREGKTLLGLPHADFQQDRADFRFSRAENPQTPLPRLVQCS